MVNAVAKMNIGFRGGGARVEDEIQNGVNRPKIREVQLIQA